VYFKLYLNLIWVTFGFGFENKIGKNDLENEKSFLTQSGPLASLSRRRPKPLGLVSPLARWPAFLPPAHGPALLPRLWLFLRVGPLAPAPPFAQRPNSARPAQQAH